MGKTLLTVTVDLREQAAVFGAIGNEAALAAASVINKSLMKMRTESTREIAATAKISPQSLVRRRMRLDKARLQRMTGAIRLLVGDISVSKLSGLRDTGSARIGRQSKKSGMGVFAYGGRSYPHAFVAKGLGGNVQVFERKGKGRRPLLVHKIPIKDIATGVLMRRIVQARDEAVALLPKEVAWRLSKRGM